MLGGLNHMAEKMGWIGVENPEEEEFYEDEELAYLPEEEYQSEASFVPSSNRFSSQEEDMEISRIVTVRPTNYAEAQTIGESFRQGYPVIVNLSEAKDERRIVDFCAGLVFGLRGSLEQITANVLLLSPETVKVQGKNSAGTRRY